MMTNIVADGRNEVITRSNRLTQMGKKIFKLVLKWLTELYRL